MTPAEKQRAYRERHREEWKAARQARKAGQCPGCAERDAKLSDWRARAKAGYGALQAKLSAAEAKLAGQKEIILSQQKDIDRLSR